jgi:general secretion pathway protein L
MRPPRTRKAGSTDGAVWRPVAGFAVAAVVVICVLLGVQQWRYERAAEDARDQAARLYKELFPQDRATARLRAQFRQRLSSLGGGTAGGSGFLELVAATGDVLAQFRSQGVTTRRLQFNAREGNLLLELQAGGYDAVESVRKELSQKELSAEIATAREDGDGVTARLRVGTG